MIPIGNRAEGPRVPWVSLRSTHGYTMDNPLRGMHTPIFPCDAEWVPRFSLVMRNVRGVDFPREGKNIVSRG